MLEHIVVSAVEFLPRLAGWSFLKVVTLGRYRGFRSEDLLLEGSLGLALIALGIVACWTLLG